jgi:hypothetical protein
VIDSRSTPGSASPSRQRLANRDDAGPAEEIARKVPRVVASIGRTACTTVSAQKHASSVTTAAAVKPRAPLASSPPGTAIRRERQRVSRP